MIISFFGHSKFYGADLSVEFVVEQIKEVAGETDAQFFLGDYGGFDAFAYQCAMEYKKMRPLTKLCFVSPYLDEDYLRRRYATERFDEVIYPDIEATPKRYFFRQKCNSYYYKFKKNLHICRGIFCISS